MQNVRYNYSQSVQSDLLFSDGCTAPEIKNPTNSEKCCFEDPENAGQCLCSVPQMDDPSNPGTCCYEDQNNIGQCLVCASSQIPNPDEPSTCCDEDLNNPGQCQNKGTHSL